MRFISRRDLLKGAGMLGAATALPIAGGRGASRQGPGLAPHPPGKSLTPAAAASPGREPLEYLTAEQADVLDAIVARLIPSDEHGPGATEARVVRYIDRALGGGGGGALESSRQAYVSGLAALDQYARASRGRTFVELSPADQDTVLVDVEKGAATGFTGSAAAFFAMVLGHTHQGTFGDPYYGGNANFVGWDLLNYPGVRTMASAGDQRALENGELKGNHKSAYDYESFTKASIHDD